MPFDVITVPGKNAIAKLRELRAAFSSTGQYPFLIGDEEEYDHLSESSEESEEEPSEVIEKSLIYNPQQEVDEIREEIEEEGSDGILGEWPGENADKGQIGIHKDVSTGAVKSKIYLGLAKLKQSWQLPAIVGYGGWNECPSPAVHCAFHRKWQKEYGAQIVTMSASVIECRLSKPPRNRKVAMDLAFQHYRYCGDIVDQGHETVSALAATLLNSSYWYFWWD